MSRPSRRDILAALEPVPEGFLLLGEEMPSDFLGLPDPDREPADIIPFPRAVEGSS